MECFTCHGKQRIVHLPRNRDVLEIQPNTTHLLAGLGRAIRYQSSIAGGLRESARGTTRVTVTVSTRLTRQMREAIYVVDGVKNSNRKTSSPSCVAAAAAAAPEQNDPRTRSIRTRWRWKGKAITTNLTTEELDQLVECTEEWMDLPTPAPTPILARGPQSNAVPFFLLAGFCG